VLASFPNNGLKMKLGGLSRRYEILPFFRI